MSANKKDSNQPELPIEGAKSASAAKAANQPTAGNGKEHIVAESVEAIAQRPFDPK